MKYTYPSLKPSGKAEFILPVILVALVLYLILIAKTSFFPIILSVALAYILDPIVRYFEMKGLKRIQIVSAIYIIVGFIVVYFSVYLITALSGEVSTLKDSWPVYLERLETAYSKLETRIFTLVPFLENRLNWDIIAPKLAGLGEKIPNIVVGIIPILTFVFLVPFFAFFLLIDGKKIINSFLNILPSKMSETALYIFSEMDQSLGNYLRGISLEASVLFVLAFIGLSAMNLEYAGAIAVIMGITSLVPYLGAVVGAVLSCIAAYVQFGTAMAVIKILLFFALLRFIDDWFLQPNILKRAVHIHPIIIVFALMAGGEIFGIWGVIFAMPAACILKVILSIIIELHRSAFNWKPKPQPARISIPYV